MACALVAAPLPAQVPVAGVRDSEISPGYYLIASTQANLVLFVGQHGSVLAGRSTPDLARRARSLLARLHAPPVRYALLMEPDTGATALWESVGAVSVVQEHFFRRLPGASASRHSAASNAEHATIGFSRVVQFHLADEDVHFVHDNDGATDAEAIVHFENAGLLVFGGMFTSDGYPAIDQARGGSLDSTIKWLGFFLAAFRGADDALEPIVPGRGPVATVDQLRQYRDMLIAVRDRVKRLADGGATLGQVLAAKPSAAFDARWGHGPVSPDDFVRGVYGSVGRRPARQ